MDFRTLRPHWAESDGVCERGHTPLSHGPQLQCFNRWTPLTGCLLSAWLPQWPQSRSSFCDLCALCNNEPPSNHQPRTKWRCVCHNQRCMKFSEWYNDTFIQRLSWLIKQTCKIYIYSRETKNINIIKYCQICGQGKLIYSITQKLSRWRADG